MFKKILCWMLIIQQINVQVLQAGPGGTSVQVERVDPERRGPAHCPSLSLQVQRESSRQRPFKQSFKINPTGEQRFEPVTSVRMAPKDMRIHPKPGLESIGIYSALKGDKFSLHVSPDGALLVQGTRAQNSLDLHTFGSLSFGDQTNHQSVYVNTLAASGRVVRNTVPLYVASLSLKGEDGIFNDVEGQLHLGPKTDFEGNFSSRGRVFLEGSSLDSHGYNHTYEDVGQRSSLPFKSYLTWGGNSSVHNVDVFANDSFMFPKAGDLSAHLFVGARTFLNRKSIEGISLEIPCQVFHNKQRAILRTKTLDLPADTARNDGVVVITEKAALAFGEYVNSPTGFWILPEDVVIRSRLFINHHTLVGRAFNLVSEAFENLGYAATLGDFKAEVSNHFGNGSDALLASLKDILLSGTSDIQIQGSMVGVGEVHLEGRSLLNQSQVVSDRSVVIRTTPQPHPESSESAFDFCNNNLVYGPDIRISVDRGKSEGRVNDVISPFILPSLQGLIAPHTLEVEAHKRFIHAGHSFGGDRVVLLGDGTHVVLKDLVTNGTLTSKARRLINRGNVLANAADVHGRRFLNERLLHVVESGRVAARYITNEDELSSEGKLDLEPMKSFENKAGSLVSAFGPLAIKGPGESHNAGNLESEDRIEEQVSRSVNHGQKIAENQIAVDTTSCPLTSPADPDFVNTNLMLSTNVTAKFHSGFNQGEANGPLDVTNPNALRGAIAEEVLLFDIGNQLENQGPLVGKQEAYFVGSGRFFNGEKGSVRSDNITAVLRGVYNRGGLMRAHHHFDLSGLEEGFENTALVLSDGSFSLSSTAKGINSGVMEGRDGLFSLAFDETENKGLMSALGGDFLLNTRLGMNRGQMKGAHNLGLTIGERFVNGEEGSTEDTGIKCGGALTADGTGVLTNQRDIISGGPLSLQNKKLENQAGSHVQATGAVTVAGGTTVSNHKGARLLSDRHIEGEEGSNVQSDGLLSGDTVTLRQPLYRSGGDTEARGDINLPNCTSLHIEKGGSLTVTEGALKAPNAKTLVTEGPLYSKGSVTLPNLESFKSSDSFETHGHLDLVATDSIENTDKLLGKAGIELKAPTITSKGPIVSEESTNLVGHNITTSDVVIGTAQANLTSSQTLTIGPKSQVQSQNGTVKLQSPSITLQGTAAGENIEIHQPANEVTQTKALPFSFNPAQLQPVQTLMLNLPGGWDLEKQTKVLEHSVILTGPLLNPAPLVIKGDFTWNCPGDLQNFFDIIVEGILTINFTTGGSWTNRGKVQGQKGIVTNPKRFTNHSAFYSGGTSTFTCPLGFDNYGAMELNGTVTVNANQGSITNHQDAVLQQKGATNSVIFIAARNVLNDNGSVIIQGNLTSQSSGFINQTRFLANQPTVKLYEDPRFFCDSFMGMGRTSLALNLDTPFGFGGNNTFQTGPRMIEALNARKDIPIYRERNKEGALFHAGSATISTPYFLNDGSTFTTQEKFTLKGSLLNNLTRHFYETGLKMVMKIETETVTEQRGHGGGIKGSVNKYRHKRKPATEKTKTVITYPFEPYSIPWKSFIARCYSQGAILAPGLNNSEGHLVARFSGFVGGDLTNMGREFIELRQTHPTFVPAADYFSSQNLQRPSFWKADPFRTTGFAIVPDKPISPVSAEEIARLVSPQSLPPQGSPEFLKALEAHLSSSFKKDITLNGGTTASKFWEVRRDDLATFQDSLTPKMLVQVPPRIAVIQEGKLTGGERMHHHPALLAEILTRVFLDVIGYASISQSLSSPELLARILEEVGYLNASKRRGLSPVPTPQNWETLSPEAQIAHQQRVSTTYAEAETFPDPSIIYRVWEDLGERVLSALVVLPEFIRTRFQALPGHLVSEYLSIQCQDVKNDKGTVKGEKALYIETQGTLVNREGTVVSGGLLATESKQALINESGAIESGSDMSLHAQDIFSSTLTTRNHFQGGYYDALHERARFRSWGHLSAVADSRFHATTSDIAAAKDVFLYGGHHTFIGAQETETSYSITEKKYTYHRQTTSNHKSNVTGWNVRIGSGGDVHTRGVNVTAVDTASVDAKGKFIDENVTDSVEEESTTSSKKRKIIKKKRQTRTETGSSTPSGNPWQGRRVAFESGDDMHLRATRVSASPGQASAVSGKAVYREDVAATSYSSTQRAKKNAFWNSQKNKGRSDTVAVTDNLPADMRFASVKGVHHHSVQEEHKKWNKRASGPTAATAAIVGLAMTIATAGVGSAVAGSALLAQALGQTGAMMVGASAQAAAASLCTQASLSLLSNKGDIGKTFKDLSSSRNVQALLTSAGSAALTAGILGNIGVSTNDTSWQSRMLRSAVPIGVSTGERILAQDLKPGAAILQGVASVLATSLASLGAEAIGDLRYPTAGQAPPIGTLEHTTLHAINGAIQGALSNLKDPGLGALGGALGAVTAENLAGFLPDSLTPEQRSNIARFGAASLAFLTNQDVNAAIQAATTTVEFNFNAHKAAELSRKVTEQEFVNGMMKDEEAEKGTFSPEQREDWEYKFRKLYYTLKQTDLSRSMLDPGRQRFEEQASLSFDEFRAQYLSQMDPQKRATVQGRQDAERIIQNHYSFYQSKGFDLAVGSVLGVAAGGASLRPMFPSRNIQALNLEGTLQESTPIQSLKKPFQEMTNSEFVQQLATRAEKKVGGIGAVAGTKKHTYARNLGVRAQERFGERGLNFEQEYKSGRPRKEGEPRLGSTRLDVYDESSETVYDYKFVKDPGKGLKPKQVEKIKKHGPLETKTIVEVNPEKKGE